MTVGQNRYAIFFLPDRDSALGAFGRHWLGYDAETGEAAEQYATAALCRLRLAEITTEPRRYGFHATLKPPFALAEGRDRGELSAAMDAFAAAHDAVRGPPLALASISQFWALVPSRPCIAIDRLAEECVRRFDAFRAPPSTAELVRRRRSGLSEAEDALLVRWGYPYVMEAFRFHLTLTQGVDGAEQSLLADELSPLVAPLCREDLQIDAISLMHQSTRNGKFRLVRRYRLASATDRSAS
jgi:putative phosphonate metabolism protein